MQFICKINFELERSNTLNREYYYYQLDIFSLYSFMASCHSQAVRVSHNLERQHDILVLECWQLLQLGHVALLLDACQ